MPSAALLLAGGQAISGIGGLAQSQFEAKALEQQAQERIFQSRENAEDFQRDQSRKMASAIAAGGASGVRQDVGSPLRGFQQFSAESELMRQRILRGGIADATNLRGQASATKRAGLFSIFGGGLRAGASILDPNSGITFGDNRKPQKEFASPASPISAPRRFS